MRGHYRPNPDQEKLLPDTPMDETIDLRSDTVTRPTQGMRQAMSNASVGDDVYGEDPSVNRLESQMAELLSHEAGLFVTSGTQGNLLAILTHCQRGEEYIAGSRSHAYLDEAGGGAVLGSVQPQPIDNEEDGTLDLEKVSAAIKPDDFHMAITRLVCLENTFSGIPLPLGYLRAAQALADRYRLRSHLDGARVFNAAIGCKVDVSEITQHFDSVSTCLSKGLGAPVGSVLTGNREFIARARRWRKMLGGGTRQAGVLAAAGLYALDHHIERLTQDHDNATSLAQLLSGLDEAKVHPADLRTNMVFVSFPADSLEGLSDHLRESGILVTAQSNPVRLVTHLDLTEEHISKTVQAMKDYFRVTARST